MYNEAFPHFYLNYGYMYIDAKLNMESQINDIPLIEVPIYTINVLIFIRNS